MIHPREMQEYEDWLDQLACESVEAEESKWRGIWAANPDAGRPVYYSTRPHLNRGRSRD